MGNLAPFNVGQARWLIATVTAYLRSAGFTWVVFTAVHALHNAFRRMALEPVALADADPHRLNTSVKDQWGNYYEGHPVVYAGNIEEGFQSLNKGVGPAFPRLLALWNEAIECGEAASDRFGTVNIAKAG